MSQRLGEKKLKTQSLTCSRAKMGAQAQEEQTIVRKLGKVEQPGAAKISFSIILLNFAGRKIAIFLLIDLFVYSS